MTGKKTSLENKEGFNIKKTLESKSNSILAAIAHMKT
jgi:hypothetical protein